VSDLKLVSESSAVSGSDRREATERALEDLNPEAIWYDGLEDAIVGIGCQYSKSPVVVYDEDLIIFTLMSEQEMEFEEAWEYYSFNIQGMWVGENTPIIITGMDELLER
jgi:hypothetical protein